MASRLLFLARKSQKALKTMSDFSARHDHKTWMGATAKYLQKAAESGGAARLQFWETFWEADDTPANSAADISPLAAGDSGWNERRMLDLSVNVRFGTVEECLESTAEFISLISATLDLAHTGACPRDVTSTADIGFLFVDQLKGRGQILKEEKVKITAIAEEMMEHAVRHGDVKALLWKVRKLRETQNRDNVQTAELIGLLERGVLAGSLELLYERGIEHEHQNRAAEATVDFAKAADLGHYAAMERIRGTRPFYGVSVSPIPAALEMTLPGVTVAVVVTTSTNSKTESIASDSGAVWKALGIQPPSAPKEGDVNSFTAEVASESESASYTVIHVAWPDLAKSKNKEDAAAKLKTAYIAVFSEASDNYTSALIVQPVPDARFGAFVKDAPEITAHAIMLALQGQAPESRQLTVTMCVFDSLSVVVAYDYAFANFGDKLILKTRRPPPKDLGPTFHF